MARKHDHTAVLAAHHTGLNQHEIAAQFGMLQSTVSKILIAAGIRVGRGRRSPMHPLPMATVAERYLAGESTVALGLAYGVDAEVIRRRLKRAGVKRRSLLDSRARGANNPQWKGGRQPTMHLYRRRSYEVAAICLGHPVPAGWVIHHLDENPMNNDWTNLVLFRTHAAHARAHQQERKRQYEGRPVDAIQLALENGARALPSPPRPIVFEPDTDQPDLFDSLPILAPVPGVS